MSAGAPVGASWSKARLGAPGRLRGAIIGSTCGSARRAGSQARGRACGPMGSGDRRRARDGERAVPLQEPGRVAVRTEVCMTEAARFFDCSRARAATARRKWSLPSKASPAAAASRGSRTRLQRVPGVVDARVNFTNRRVTAAWRNGETRSGSRSSIRSSGWAMRRIRLRRARAETEDARAAR